MIDENTVHRIVNGARKIMQKETGISPCYADGEPVCRNACPYWYGNYWGVGDITCEYLREKTQGGAPCAPALRRDRDKLKKENRDLLDGLESFRRDFLDREDQLLQVHDATKGRNREYTSAYAKRVVEAITRAKVGQEVPRDK